MLAAKSKCARMAALSCLALIAGCASDTPAPERCGPYEVEEAGFAYRSQAARVDVQWHSEWTEAQGEALPEPLAPPDIWTHPHLSARYSAAMHEDSHASDVSRLAGPTPFGAEVEYFHVLEKGKRLSGMAPFYTFLDDETMITISFGRDAATLLVVDVKDEIEVLDQVDIPGRGSTLFELAGKKGRVAIFRDTSGGAYSYVDKKGDVYVPGASNSIIRIPIRDRRIQRDAMVQLNLGYEVTKGSLEDVVINDMKEDNKLTAIMPDANGRIWFTSRYGIVGVMDPSRRTEDGCPVVHASPIAYFAAEQKLRQLFDPLSEEGEAFITEFNRGGADLEDFRALRAEARRIFMAESGPLPSWVPATVGFLAGGAFLWIVDKLLPHLHPGFPKEEAEGVSTSWQRSVLLVLAITIHNIPEGLAVGVAFGALAADLPAATLGGAVALGIGIGIQNFPEGAAVSVPLRREGISRLKSFWYGQLSGVVEPIAGVLGAVAVIYMRPILPYALAFAAGAMIYVVVEELVPESQLDKHTDVATVGAMLGFAVMMTLDVALG